MTAPDIATWLGIGLSILTMVGLYLKQRDEAAKRDQAMSEAIAVNARRLDNMERWQAEKSIDRKELVAVDEKGEARADALRESFAAAHREHDMRMVVMEREAKDNAKTLGELRLELARIPEQLRGQDNIAQMRHEATAHSMANLKQMIMALARKQGVLVPSEPDL